MADEMILGIGIDVCRVARIRKSISRFGQGFAASFCREDEVRHAEIQPCPETAYAMRFAAKEALAKALSTGFGTDLWWDDLEVVVSEQGSHHFLIAETTLQQFEVKLNAPNGINVHLSVDSNKEYCSAFVIVEKV